MTPQDYQLVQHEVKALAAKLKWAREDREDFLQDVTVKLLESAPEYVNVGYLRLLFQRMLIDRNRRESRRPKIIYSSDLADYILNKK